MKKSITAIFVTTIFLISMIAPIISMNTAQAADPASWYKTVNGVLASDSYSLYPYAKQNLNIGMSKFGELIDDVTNVGLEYAGARDPFAPLAGAALDNVILPKNVWINGWFIDIKYIHSTWGPKDVWAGALFADLSAYAGPWLRVDNGYSGTTEAAEKFTDMGKPLDALTGNLVTPTGILDLQGGGRKTNGTVITDPIEVLYDGPREFIGIIRNHIYDWQETGNYKLLILDLDLTIHFDKVKKEVTVLKDVKLAQQAKFQIDPMPILIGSTVIPVPYGVVIQLSDRDEWDLGLDQAGTTKYSSYVHFYTQGISGTEDTIPEGQSTVYNNAWTANPTLPAGYKIDLTGYPIPAMWTPSGGYAAYGTEPKASGTYDVAQIISNDKLYVGWAAFWPSCSDWSADAGGGRRNLWYKSMQASDKHDIDSYLVLNDEPFVSPLTIGEWDALLSDTARSYSDNVAAYPQFRGVTKYGVTDLHDGKDYNMAGHPINTIDKEARYQLNQNFNPWDLLDAVEKQEKRWVQFFSGTGSLTTFTVTQGMWDPYSLYNDDNGSATWWTADTYSKLWSVQLSVTGDYPAVGEDYASVRANMSKWNFQIQDIENLAFWYKITGTQAVSNLFNTWPMYKQEGVTYSGDSGMLSPYLVLSLDTDANNVADKWVISQPFGRNSATSDWQEWSMEKNAPASGGFDPTEALWHDESFTDDATTGGAGAWPAGWEYLSYFQDSLVGAKVLTISIAMGSWVSGTAMQFDGVTQTCLVDELSIGAQSYGEHTAFSLELDEGKVMPNVFDSYCNFTERVLVNNVLKIRGTDYTIDFVTGLITFITAPPAGTNNIKVLYSTIRGTETEPTNLAEGDRDWYLEGRYEWTIVGRDASTVDSAGAALVTAAIKNKKIEIGLSGEDMFGLTYDYQIPSVMSKLGTSTVNFPTPAGTKADYKDLLGTGNAVGFRAHLADDWCTYWPVASSDMIGVGGPRANMLAYYGNDFTDAFFGMEEFCPVSADYPVNPYSAKITGIPCWNRGWSGTWNVYSSVDSTSTGYAVIATTKDINGTVIFLVYGHTGRDTFYASLWLHGDAARGLSPGIVELQDAPPGLTSIILKINYADAKHPTYTIPECLGTISETLWNCTLLTQHTDVTNLLKGGIHDP